jgi:hypothetical protein
MQQIEDRIRLLEHKTTKKSRIKLKSIKKDLQNLARSQAHDNLLN